MPPSISYIYKCFVQLNIDLSGPKHIVHTLAYSDSPNFIVQLPTLHTRVGLTQARPVIQKHSTQHSASRCGFAQTCLNQCQQSPPTYLLRPFLLSHRSPMEWPQREISWALSIMQVIVILASQLQGKSGCHRIKYYPGKRRLI